MNDNNKKNILFILLIIAYLNAVLRPSMKNPVTAFRLLLPFAWIAIFNISRQTLARMFAIFSGITCLSFFQYYLAKEFFFPEVSTFSIPHLIEFLYHILCIVTVVGIVVSLRYIYQENFNSAIIKFGANFCKVFVVLGLIYSAAGGNPIEFHIFGNVNNFGCVVAVGIILYLFDGAKRFLSKIIWISLSMALLLYNDSKMAFLGAVMAIGLFLIVIFSKMTNSIMRRFLTILLLFIGIVIVVFLINSEILINGYSLRGMTIEPTRRILSGEYYSYISTSQTFRANVIIAILLVLQNSFLLGVGVGNTGLIIRTMVPDPDMILRQYLEVSSHIWWLEEMADFGLIVIILFLIGYLKAWKLYINTREVTPQLFGLICIISFPIWSMSASGLYTEYFSLSMVTFAIMVGFQQNAVPLGKETAV